MPRKTLEVLVIDSVPESADRKLTEPVAHQFAVIAWRATIARMPLSANVAA